MKGILVLAALILAGCATQITPEMRQLADQRKGERHKIDVKLDPKIFEKRCGYAKSNETMHCSQNILATMVQDEARNYCVFYGPYKINWDGRMTGMYSRMYGASTTITCIGSRNTADQK